MINVTDIYARVGKKLLECDFINFSTTDKKIKVLEEITNYTLEKFGLKDNKLSLDEILNEVNKLIDSEDDSIFAHYTHYLLGIISNMQGKMPIWWCDEKVSGVQFNLDCNYNLDSITTSKKISYLEIFQALLDYFKNQFQKELQLTK